MPDITFSLLALAKGTCHAQWQQFWGRMGEKPQKPKFHPAPCLNFKESLPYSYHLPCHFSVTPATSLLVPWPLPPSLHDTGATIMPPAIFGDKLVNRHVGSKKRTSVGSLWQHCP